MNPRVKNVKPKDNYKLILTFTNGEVKIFDVKPYLGIGIFKELIDVNLFNSVKPFLAVFNGKTGKIYVPIRYTWKVNRLRKHCMKKEGLL